MLADHSGCGLLIYEVSARIGVLGFVPLLLAVSAVPLLWENLLLKADHVEPLSLAVGVFAGHHFPEGVPSAVAVLRVLGEIVVEVLFLSGLHNLARVYLHALPLQNLLFGLVLVLGLQLVQELIGVVADLVKQLISNLFFLLAVAI